VVDRPADHDIDAPEAGAARTTCANVAVLDKKDDDKNGYVDDTYGYNAIKGKGSGEDDNGHGTHVSGIVAARGTNALGDAGTCWSSKLVAVKFMNSRGKGSTSDAIEGIEYAVKKGLKIISYSNPALRDPPQGRQAAGFTNKVASRRAPERPEGAGGDRVAGRLRAPATVGAAGLEPATSAL
jgi:subtilisin family serine protease